MSEKANAAPVLILCRDLLFASKITSAAQAQGVTFKVIRDPAKLAGELGQKLILDLNQEGAIDAAAAWKREARGETIGFVSHVDAQTITQARGAGIDQVFARSQFVIRLPSLIAAL